MPIIATSIVGALTGVAQAVGGIKNETERLQMEKNLSFLTAKQRNDLDKALLKTNDKNKQLEILYNAVANIKSAQSTATINTNIQRERTLALAVVGGAIVILIGIVLYKKL